jgi:hypothetical protein
MISKPESIEQIRERIRNMSDAELRKYGRAAQASFDPKKNLGLPNPVLQTQLNEARTEWRRRYHAASVRRSPRIPEL